MFLLCLSRSRLKINNIFIVFPFFFIGNYEILHSNIIYFTIHPVWGALVSFSLYWHNYFSAALKEAPEVNEGSVTNLLPNGSKDSIQKRELRSKLFCCAVLIANPQLSGNPLSFIQVTPFEQHLVC